MSAKKDLQTDYTNLINMPFYTRNFYLSNNNAFLPGDFQKRINTAFRMIDYYSVDTKADGNYIFWILLRPGTWQNNLNQYLADVAGPVIPNPVPIDIIVTQGGQIIDNVNTTTSSANKKDTGTTTINNVSTAGWDSGIKSAISSLLTQLNLNIDPTIIEYGLGGLIIYTMFLKNK